MIQIRQTEVFATWLRALRDRRARARIQVRIDRVQLGLPGDARPVGEGVSELRIDYGPGYRVYFTRPARECVVLLAGVQWRLLCYGPVRWWRVALALGLLGIARPAG